MRTGLDFQKSQHDVFVLASQFRETVPQELQRLGLERRDFVHRPQQILKPFYLTGKNQFFRARRMPNCLVSRAACLRKGNEASP
jgi:hypothetical protein